MRSEPSTRRERRRRLTAGLVIGIGLIGVLSTTMIHPALVAHSPRTPLGSLKAEEGDQATTPEVTQSLDTQVAAARDRVATRPMPDTGTGRFNGEADLSTDPPPQTYALLLGKGMGPADVPTGYPETAQGAISQLVAIEVVAAQSASIPGVQRVIRNWAESGGPTPSTWTWRTSMAELLQMLEVPSVGSTGLSIVARPAMALVKDLRGEQTGKDWSVVCVDLSLDLIVDGTTHHGVVADCQRMTWDGRRWLIGTGTQPTQFAAQPLPGTDAAYDAGFRDLIVDPDEAALAPER